MVGIVGSGFQVVGPGFQSWVGRRAFWVSSRGSWVVGRGSWVVGRGSWVIDWKGSASARRRFLRIRSISKQTLLRLQQQIKHVHRVNENI